MVFKFISKKKWIREGIFSIIYVVIITFLSIYSFLKYDVGGLTAIYPILIVIGIYRAIYYFKLHKKDYLQIEGSSLSIYRGNIIPRKRILFHKVEHVVQANEVLVFRMDDGKEHPIYTDHLSNDDKEKLKKELKLLFTSKVVGF